MSGLRVFLSSTAVDLVEYRKIADDTLLRLQQRSVVMERFGALPGTPVAECERLAASSDLVVCIVAHRYGYEPEAGRGSITRREVEAARNAGKHVYAWIVDDKHPWTEPKEQDRLTQADVLADSAKTLEVAAAVKSLQDFKVWLRREFVTDTFTTADDLGRKIATTLANTPAAAASARGRGSLHVLATPELRIVHALQPAPHFHGRDDLVRTLSAWVDDIASPDRIHALVAAGGTGKTAIAEQVVSLLQQRWPPPGAGSVLVWSFYEKPDADAFVRECAQLFLGEPDDAPAGGRLERLQRGLGRLHDRGLVFRYTSTDGTATWTAHPFVRERFAGLLGCPAEIVFDAVARRLGQGLERRPDKSPEDTETLDRYERLIEAMRLAGRSQDAFDLFWFGLGGYPHLGKRLGEYARGYRILRGFMPPSGDPKSFGVGLTARDQSMGLNELALTTQDLGRLLEAADLRREDDARRRVLDEANETSIGLQNTCDVALDLGRLDEVLTTARKALAEAARAENDGQRMISLATRATAQHRLGNIAAARDDFAAASALEKQPALYSVVGQKHAVTFWTWAVSALVARAPRQVY